jgi:hypothetical protein
VRPVPADSKEPILALSILMRDSQDFLHLISLSKTIFSGLDGHYRRTNDDHSGVGHPPESVQVQLLLNLDQCHAFS